MRRPRTKIVATVGPATTAEAALDSLLEAGVDVARVNCAHSGGAEATDVANAVIDGADALMLSAETARGRYPLDAVTVMRKIILESEKLPEDRGSAAPESAMERSAEDAVARAACLAADTLEANAIVCLTQSGATARYLAKWRPSRPVLAVTPNQGTWRRLSLLWGTEPVLTREFSDDFDQACRQVLEELRQSNRLTPGRKVVIMVGLPFARRLSTNTVRVETV